LDENYSTNEGQGTGQRPSNGKAKGGAEYDEEVSTTGTDARKGSSGTSSEDSEDSEVSEGETRSSTKSGSSKSALKDTEEDSGAVDLKDNGTEDEGPISTSSRLKTVHSKPTSTPLPTGNINAATPTLPLPDTPLSSAQPVGCAGGTNASSYCSAPASTNHATLASRLDSRMLFATVLVLSFGLL